MLQKNERAAAITFVLAELTRRTLIKVAGNDLSTSIGQHQLDDVAEGLATSNLKAELQRKGCMK